MRVIGVVLLAVALGALEVPGLIRERQWRQIGAVTTILVIGAVWAGLLAIRVPLPSISQVLQWIVGPLSRV